MAYQKSPLDIPLRDPELPYEALGPGLYEDEYLYVLDTGELIAVSIRRDRHQTSNGLTFQAWARAIDETGQTLVDTIGQELEIEHRHVVDPGSMTIRALTDITKDVLHLLLGEPLETRDVDGEQVEWIALSPDVKASLSIRNAIWAASPEQAGSLDVGAILP